MATAPDEFDAERSRAAVAVACLQWLRCTGPAVPAEIRPARVTSPDVVRLLRDFPENHAAAPFPEFPQPHPLWDRWIDG